MLTRHSQAAELADVNAQVLWLHVGEVAARLSCSARLKTRQPVRAQGAGEAVQLHFAKIFRVNCALHLREYALRQDDFAAARVLAKATRKVRHRPDRG